MTLGDWIQIGIGVVAVTVTAVVYALQRSRRAVGYGILTDRSILNDHHSFSVEVRFEGVVVKNPRLIVVRVVNSGNQAIGADQFETPITVRVPGADILSFDRSRSRPATYAPALSRTSTDSVQVQPCLMNARDMVEMQLLVDGGAGRPLAQARITGVSRLDEIKVSRTSWDEPWKISRVDQIFLSVPIFGFGALGVLLAMNDDLAARFLGAAMLVFACIVYPWQAWRSLRRNSLIFSADQ